ncbi:acyl transferase [Mesonia sp. K7]|uniref:LuxE/PaaK family acyltransferase n=1 Tax=Mesonia sp. K7 TaxID=2218606 RepID=UPI000DA91FE2|nr:acyl transferase [Mesonia sp. K7]PZD77734.1 acyl transferase [Mesonia sp. K7]
MGLQQKIFNINSEKAFEETALEVFEFQYENNLVYQEYCHHLKLNPTKVLSLDQIPFLPIEFFKTHQVTTQPNTKHQKTYTSSGTTSQNTSKHFVYDYSLYEKSFLKTFQHFYGAISEFAVLALLPSYLEREGSSLVQMAKVFIEKSKYPESGFYLDNRKELTQKLHQLEQKKIPTLLIGVSFALLDLVEEFSFSLKSTIVMETGGMKGRRKEMIREELHEILKKGFGVPKIHSEYGMTELLSQAYSKGDGIFETPNYMKVLIRDPEDPFSLKAEQQNGGINVIDLANLYSCSFIATQDLGKKLNNTQFEVLGRFDNSDIRGCNLLVL